MTLHNRGNNHPNKTLITTVMEHRGRAWTTPAGLTTEVTGDGGACPQAVTEYPCHIYTNLNGVGRFEITILQPYVINTFIEKE